MPGSYIQTPCIHCIEVNTQASFEVDAKSDRLYIHVICNICGYKWTEFYDLHSGPLTTLEDEWNKLEEWKKRFE